MIFLYLAALVVAFIVGKQYGARVEKKAVAVALLALTEAKALFARVVTKARADAQAEVARLEDIAKKYL